MEGFQFMQRSILFLILLFIPNKNTKGKQIIKYSHLKAYVWFVAEPHNRETLMFEVSDLSVEPNDIKCIIPDVTHWIQWKWSRYFEGEIDW